MTSDKPGNGANAEDDVVEPALVEPGTELRLRLGTLAADRQFAELVG